MKGEILGAKMKRAGWSLDHIGIAVRDIETAKKFYLSSAGYTEGFQEENLEHQIRALFLQGEHDLLELISPLPGNVTLQKFLDKRGEGLHHLCYKVPSVSAELATLETAGLPLVDKCEREGARGLKVAFLHPKASGSGVLIEICSEK